MIESMYKVEVTLPSGKRFTEEFRAQDEQEALDRAIWRCYVDHKVHKKNKDWRPSNWHSMNDEQRTTIARSNGYNVAIVRS